MTHDELVAKIDYAIEGNPYDEYMSAIRAVVGLHKPQEITLPDGAWGTNCAECDGLQYPCQTICAIESWLR
jgi:hypothetical protein